MPWFIIEFLIKPAPVPDGFVINIKHISQIDAWCHHDAQFVLVSVEEEKESWVAAETLQGNDILRRNLSIWRTETYRDKAREAGAVQGWRK